MAKREYLGVAMDTLMDDDTTELAVWIPSLNPFVQDDPAEELVDSANVINLAPNTKGNVKVKAVSTVLCEYWGKSNTTRPNVHKGEHLSIVEYEDNGNYFWDVIGTNDDVRTTEHVKIHIASKPNQLDPLTPQSTYYFEMDSRDGQRHVTIHTSQFNGEKVGYDIVVNLDDSNVSLIDSVGNNFSLESLKQHWHLANKNGDFIDIVPDVIHLNTKQFILDAAEQILLRSPKLEGIIASSHLTGTLDADKIIKSLIDCISATISGKTHKHTRCKGVPTSPPIP